MMGDFFHGWQHKTACYTLVLASFLAAIWVRGLIAPKSVELRIGQRKHVLTTNAGRLIWVSYDKVEGQIVLDAERLMMPLLSDTPSNQIKRTIEFQDLVLCLILFSVLLVLCQPRKNSRVDHDSRA